MSLLDYLPRRWRFSRKVLVAVKFAEKRKLVAQELLEAMELVEAK